MATSIPAIDPASITTPGGGFIIYDSNLPNVLGPAVVNTYTTLSIPAWWRGISFLAQNMASFPRYVTLKGTKTKHRLTSLLTRRPNTYQSVTTFWSTLYFARCHYNNGYARIERDYQNRPIALHNCRPELVMPFRWIDEATGTPSTYYYIGGNRPMVVPAADMIHLHGPQVYDGLAAFNPIWLLQETLERARLIDRYMTRFLVKGSIVRGAIEIPGMATQEQRDGITGTIRQWHAGADADKDMLILDGGAKLNNSTLSPQDSELTQQASYTTKQIAQILGLPPAFLFDLSEGKYNESLEQSWAMVQRDSFRPLIEAEEDELSLKLLTDAEADAEYEIEVDSNALIRGDTQTESTVAIAQVNSGVISRNEGRAMLGFPADPDPTSDQLRALGDTNPTAAKPPAEPVNNSTPAKPGMEQFAALITDAAQRVGTKTTKALDNHKGKDGWTPWSNVFAEEQGRFAAQTVAPILATVATVTGHQFAEDAAGHVGERYAQQLRTYFARIGRGETAEQPDLSQIIRHVQKQGEDEAKPETDIRQ